MTPSDIGKAYNQITNLWDDDTFHSGNGIEQHKRALGFLTNSLTTPSVSTNTGYALDVGCGRTGRFIDLLLAHGLEAAGVDISEQMLALAKERHPAVQFYQEDICTWDIPQQYDFISAWDSLWHIPLKQQAHVLTKLVASLTSRGIFIFSFGGTDTAGEHTNNTMGPEMYYSTLGVTGYLTLMTELGCTCKHLEFDQHPEPHTYLIVQKA